MRRRRSPCLVAEGNWIFFGWAGWPLVICKCERSSKQQVGCVDIIFHVCLFFFSLVCPDLPVISILFCDFSSLFVVVVRCTFAPWRDGLRHHLGELVALLLLSAEVSFRQDEQ